MPGWHSLCRKGHPTDWDGVPAIYIGAKPEILMGYPGMRRNFMVAEEEPDQEV